VSPGPVTMAHLLDTDVSIEILRRRDPAIRARLAETPEVAVSTITVAELCYGAARASDPSANRAAVEEFLAHVTVLDLDSEAAAHAGEIRTELAAAGRPIGAYDLLIAGQARSRGFVVVTRNVKEFDRVAGLRVETW